MTLSSHRTLRRLAGLLLLLAICVPSQAGGGFKRAWKKFNEWLEKGQYEGIDTAYIQVPRLNRQIYLGGYAYWQSYRMDMPVHLEDVAEGYNFNGTYHQKAHSWQAEVDLGIDWKGLAVELPIPVRNKYSFSIGLAKNGSVWGARFRYKNLRRMDGTCTIDEYPIDESSNSIKTFYIEGYYILMPKKFSIGAGLFADMIQRRSAGSPLIYANYYHSRYRVEQFFPANFDSFRTNQISLGAGYAYNLSFLRGRLVFHASVVPMFTFYNNLKHMVGYDDNFFTTISQDPNAKEAAKAASGLTDEQWNDFYRPAEQGSARFRVNAFARFAANYSFDRFIVTLLCNYRHYGYSNDLDLKILNQEADIQLNFCTRF